MAEHGDIRIGGDGASYDDRFAYQPVDSAVPVPSHERHTDQVTFRLSPRLRQTLEQRARDEQTSVDELVREALASRWNIK